MINDFTPSSGQNSGNTPQQPQFQPQPSPPTQPPLSPTPPTVTNEPPNKFTAFRHKFKGAGSFIGFVISVVLLATLINLFVFQSYYVDGTSMTPTLQPNERLIINKLPKTWANLKRGHFIPQRGEIVVFNSNLRGADGRNEQLIKRVIGLPGERVVVKEGKITVYNAAYPDGFNPDTSLHLSLAETDGDVDVVVPANQLFVCGDNRTPGGSYDSRSELGTVETSSLVGELKFRVIPLNKAKFF